MKFIDWVERSVTLRTDTV